MNLMRTLNAPWVAMQPASTRWFVTGVLALDLAAALAAAVFAPALAGVMVLLVGIGIVWVFVLPGMLWLTQAANRLRLPGVRRDVAATLALAIVATLALPALLAVVAGASPMVAIVLATLVACLAFLYAILPWIVAVGLSFVPAAATSLLRWLALPGPDAPGFTAWAAPVAGALAVIAIWRWLRLRRRANLQTYYLFRPLVIGFNRTMLGLGTHGAATTSPYRQGDPALLLRQRPEWLQPRADLRRTGPAFPCRSLRVALGGAYLPQRWMRHWPVLVLVALACLVAASIAAPGIVHRLGDVFGNAAGNTLALGVRAALALVSVVVPVAYAQYLQLVWRRSNAELPVLALLPGMGTTDQLKRSLWLAAMGKPILILLVLWILDAGMAAVGRAGVGATVLLLIAPVLSAGWLAVAVTSVFAGNLGRVGMAWFEWTSISGLLVLACVGAALPVLFPASVAWLALAWLVWAAWVGAIGWQAWRRFVQCPHAFLAPTR